MLLLWNDNVTAGTPPVAMTNERLQKMKAVLKNQFQDSLNEWGAYCQKIVTSKFLMGEKGSTWKITLDWALNPSNIQKIKEGAYGIGDRLPEPSSQKLPEEDKLASWLLRVQDNPHTSETFKKFQKSLIDKIGIATYIAWFANVHEGAAGKDILILRAPNQFMADHINQRFLDALETAAHACYGRELRIRIVCN